MILLRIVTFCWGIMLLPKITCVFESVMGFYQNPIVFTFPGLTHRQEVLKPHVPSLKSARMVAKTLPGQGPSLQPRYTLPGAGARERASENRSRNHKSFVWEFLGLSYTG